MIVKSFIRKNLQTIDRTFRRTRSRKDALFLSKLAIIELSGWVEVTMDDIVRRSYKKCLNQDKWNFVEKQVIKKNYGFAYEYHFRRMCISVFGLHGFELIERQAENAVIDIFKAELSALKESRDRVAHTYVKGTTQTIDAPSLTLSRFDKLYTGFVEFESGMKKCNYLRA